MAVDNISFDWDPRKARANLAKHGISFDEARTSFYDDHARIIDDPDHSEAEARFLLLGYSHRARCLIVSHCFRHANAVIRIISARRATHHEEAIYWNLR